MRTLEGGCSIPIGVYTEFIEDETTKKIKLSFEGAVFSLDGSRQIGDKIENDDITSEDQAKTLGFKIFFFSFSFLCLFDLIFSFLFFF